MQCTRAYLNVFSFFLFVIVCVIEGGRKMVLLSCVRNHFRRRLNYFQVRRMSSTETSTVELVLSPVDQSARGPTDFSHWGAYSHSKIFIYLSIRFSNSKSFIGKCISRRKKSSFSSKIDI